VLILLPPSESKAEVARGKPLVLEGLSFPELTVTRSAVLDALIEVSARPDAMACLDVPRTLVEVVARNVRLRSLPTAPAERVYAGVLYDALAAGDLDAASRRRARARFVVISALWGAIRLGDRIPPYRLNMCGRLPGLGHLPQVWQEPLARVLPAQARRGVVVDCRSSDYVTAWRPAGDVADRTVKVKIVREREGRRSAVSHSAKHTRGLVARRLVLEAADPRHPVELAEVLSPHFDVALQSPARSGQPWELQVVEPAHPPS
jgi:uncharacterized protein